MRTTAAFTLSSIIFIAIGCSDQTPTSNPAAKSEPTQAISDDGTIWTFRENVPASDWAELCRRISSAKRLEFLDPNQERLNFAAFANTTELKSLRFDGPFDRADLGPITDCSTLNRLNLANSNLTDDDLADLQKLDTLTSLRIGSAGLTDAVLEAVASGWPKLTHLHLIRPSITDDGLSFLYEASALESLYLDDADVSDDALRSLVERRPDLHLHVDQLHLDE